MNTTNRTCLKTLRAIVLLLAAVSLGACNQFGKESAGGGSSLSAEIDGMESGDENLAGIKYEIICNDKPEKRIRGKVDGNDKRVVDFPEDELPLGVKCALEITADAREKEGVGTFEWRAFKSDNTPYVGLFYSSNFATVELVNEDGKSKKYVAFKVIKTYGIDYNDPFTAQVPVEFDAEQGAVIPDAAGLLASLECRPTNAPQAEPFYESSIQAAKIDDNKRMFDFKLSANRMQGISCTKLSVAINNVVLYEGEMSHVNFKSPQAGDSPESDKNLSFNPVKVRPNQETYGSISCESQFDNGKCSAIKINQGAEIWFAVVVMNVGGEDQEILVSPGLGLGIDTAIGTKSVFDLQQVVDGGSGNYPFTFYRDTALAKIVGNNDDNTQRLNFPYTPATATSINADKITDLSALNGATVKYFKTVYSHGFRTVAEGLLNTYDAARWFAKMNVTDNAGFNADVIIAGGNKYFETAQGQKPAAARDAFFTVGEYQKDNNQADNRYRTYVYQGGSWANNCGLNFDFFRTVMGQKTTDQMNQADANIDACELKDAAQLSSLRSNNLIFTPRYYLWGWHSLQF